MDKTPTTDDAPSRSKHHASDSGRRSGSGRERREREDRDAKRKARSNDGASSAPGAHASTGEHKSSRKSSNRSSNNGDSKEHSSSRSSRKSDEKADYRSSRSGSSSVPGAQAERSSNSRSSRSRKSDEKADYRSSRSGSASTPGAQAERSSRSKKDEKGKERRSTRATKPGAEGSTSSRDRSKAKSSSGRNTEPDINASSLDASARSSAGHSEGLPKIGDDEEPVVTAITVEEEKEDEDSRKRREEARIQKAVAAERKQMQAEQQRMQEDMEQREAERKEMQRKKNKRNKIICVVLLLLAIGGGVGAFFALRGSSSSDVVTPQEETLGPSADPSTAPSLSRSNDPSSAPTDLILEHEQPSPEECERIAARLPIDGEAEMLDRSFAVPMEVELLEGNEIGPLVPDLETAIEKLFVPDLIGCSRDFFAKRRLGKTITSNNNAVMMSMPTLHRQLQSVMSIRYAIGKAFVTVIVTDDACERSSSPNCSVVTAQIDLKVKGEYKLFLLIALIANVFPDDKDIRPALELVAPFNTIYVGIINSLDPAAAPSVAPTVIGSENPSSSPSTSPTSAPVIGPTSPAPTNSPSKLPTKAPSNAPTSPPTLAPTPTPPPTVAPQPDLTPPPTPPPTANPTIAPTTTPSTKPTSKPSSSPSGSPSTLPSVAPTSTPVTGSRLGFIPLLRPQMFHDQTSEYFTLTHPAGNALDGNYDTIIATGAASGADSWRIQLSEYYGQFVTLNKVTIWNRRDCCPERLEGAVVKVWGPGSANLVAESQPLTSAEVQTVDFGEIKDVQWISVMQSSKAEILQFAEIEAWGSIPNDSNQKGYTGLIRQGMYTDQSTDYPYASHPAINALDGNYDSIIATGVPPASDWWRILLKDYYGKLVTVNKVTLFNRRDCCPERLEGAVVELFGASTGTVGNKIATSAPLTSAEIQTVDFGEVTGVEWIKVIRYSDTEILQFAEIEAWGKVP